MASEPKRELLRRIPSLTELLKTPAVARWTRVHPQALITECLRRAVAAVREQVRADSTGLSGPAEVTTEAASPPTITELHVSESVDAAVAMVTAAPAPMVTSLVAEPKAEPVPPLASRVAPLLRYTRSWALSARLAISSVLPAFTVHA